MVLQEKSINTTDQVVVLTGFGVAVWCHINHYMSTLTKKVHDVICMVLDLEQQGGRLIQRDAETLILVDYDCVATSSLDLILEQFPYLEISTHSSEISSTGFIVIFVQPQIQQWYKKAGLVQWLFVFATFSLAAPSLSGHYSLLLGASSLS